MDVYKKSYFTPESFCCIIDMEQRYHFIKKWLWLSDLQHATSSKFVIKSIPVENNEKLVVRW